MVLFIYCQSWAIQKCQLCVWGNSIITSSYQVLLLTLLQILIRPVPALGVTVAHQHLRYTSASWTTTVLTTWETWGNSQNITGGTHNLGNNQNITSGPHNLGNMGNNQNRLILTTWGNYQNITPGLLASSSSNRISSYTAYYKHALWTTQEDLLLDTVFKEYALNQPIGSLVICGITSMHSQPVNRISC